MEEFLISSIISLLSEVEENAFLGVKGKIRLFRLKKQLRKDIFERILKTYGERVFYNDLDQFLTKNDVICNIIRNCSNASVFDYKSQSQLVMYYVQRFAEEHPNYARYHYEVRAIIQNCFEIVFNSLNRIPDENARVITITFLLRMIRFPFPRLKSLAKKPASLLMKRSSMRFKKVS